MPSECAASPALTSRFAHFYADVVAIKQAVAANRLGRLLEPDAAQPPTDGAELAALASARLRLLLEEDEKLARNIGGASDAAAWAIAHYATTALVDEQMLIEFDWPGREAWMNVLLERARFGTATAGRDFFNYVEQLLQRETRTATDPELAAVLLLALHLGFRGALRGRHGQESLAVLRARLHRLSVQNRVVEDPLEQAPVISLPQRHLVVPRGRWLWVLLCGALTYGLLSTAVWHTSFGDVQTRLRALVQGTR